MKTPDGQARPAKKGLRFRPGWHRIVGWALLVIGLGIAVLNDVMLIAPGTTMLPSGHNEFYLVAGLAVAGWSVWWFGWMDRTA